MISNGIGGYASSTIIGTNTRKYHGLLVAPINPPAGRHLILSKVDESIEIDGQKYDLYTNMNKNYISQGYKYQEAFRKEYLPIFTYKVGEVEITKVICLEYGKNTVGIYYKVKNSNHNLKLTLAPLLNFRNYHYTSTNHTFNIKQETKQNKVTVTIDNNTIYINVPNSQYIQYSNDSFNNMFYLEEEKRGFTAEENHAIPGVFEIEIGQNEEKEISFICSLEENIEELNVKDLIDKEIIRLNHIFNESLLIDNRKTSKTDEENENDELIKKFLIATDNFVTYRPMFRTYTLIAGYPWFLDWTRDTLISFEGILLITKRYEIARQVLLTCIRDIKYGLIPNGYSDTDNRPLYNSVDSSLLLFEQVQRYLNYTGDLQFIKENLYDKLKSILENYAAGIDLDDNNIYLDYDNLIVSGTENTQNTWMDAKYDGKAVTPRNGKAVEINALWYNSLCIMADLENKIGNKIEAKKYQELARKTKLSFNDKFYNKKKKCLFDVLGDGKVRPNQLFALSLTYPVIDANSDAAKNIMNTVTKKLLNNYGLKTLAKGEKDYVEVYEGDGYQRDTSYHQGITWPWLLGLYYNALKNMIEVSKSKKEKELLQNQMQEFRKNVKETFSKEIYTNGCICGISELYDSKKPYMPKGTINQAWSVAEVFRIILGK